MLKQYIEFFYPGSFVSETSVQEVADRTPPTELPKAAYAYRFFARSEVMQDGEMLRGQPKDYSPTTYYGEAMTLEEVKALHGDSHRILIGNMECNRWKRVVRVACGQFFPLEDGDVVVPSNAELTGASGAFAAKRPR